MINLNIFNPIFEYYNSIRLSILIDISFGYYSSGSPWTGISIYIPSDGIIYQRRWFVQKNMVREIKKAYQFLVLYTNNRFKIQL